MKKRSFLFFSLIPFSLIALPQGENVKAGKAIFAKKEGHLVIEAADKTIIDYESFNIGREEKVEMIQPKSSSTLLNRVRGKNFSEILGKLSSNGKVFLVNQNGVYFGPEAVVDTGSFIASTLDILDHDFIQEKYCFTLLPGTETSQIRNEGQLLSLNGGSVVLLAPQILNEGTIFAEFGQVALVCSEKVTVDFIGDGLVQFAVEGLVKEGGRARRVAVDPHAAKQILQDVVNSEGLIVGTQLIEEEGMIRLAPSSRIQADDVKVIGSNLHIEGEMRAGWDASLEAQDLLCIRDSQEAPLILSVGRHFTIDGSFIDVLTWENTQSFFGSKANMTFYSDCPISADGNFYAGGDFSLLKRDGSVADFMSFLDPIITSSGNITFGNYTGASLKVEAAGNITFTGSTLTITGSDPGACSIGNCSSDPDCSSLTTQAVLILVAGAPPASPSCNPVPISSGGATFSNPGGSLGSTIFLSQSNNATLMGFSNATFTGNVNAGNQLSIISSGGMTFNGSITANILTLTSGAGGTTQINGGITTQSVTATGMNFNVTQGISATVFGSSQLINVMVSGAINIAGFVNATNEITLQSTGSGTITLGANVQSTFDPVIISTGGSLLLTNASGTTIQANADSLSISAATIDATNNQPVSFNASTSNVNVSGLIGTVNPPISFSILAENITIDSNINTGSGGISINSILNSVQVAEGTFITAGGPFSSSSMDLTGDVTVTTSGGELDINGADGAYSLTVNTGAGPAHLNGAIGSSTPLTTLTATSSQMVRLGSNITTTSTLKIAGPAVLNTTVTATSTGGPIDFTSTIDGAHSLTLTAMNQPITVSGNIGGITPLINLTVNTTSNFAAKNITTTGNLTITNAITQASLQTLSSGGAVAITTTNQLDLEGSITAMGSIVLNGGMDIFLHTTAIFSSPMAVTLATPLNPTSGGIGLTLTSSNTITVNDLGTSSPLGSFTVSAGATNLTVNGDVTTSGPFTIDAPVLLNTGSTWTTNNGTLNVDSIDGPFSLNIIAGSGVVNLNDFIGNANPLTEFNITSSGGIGPTPPIAEIEAGSVALTSTGTISIGALTTSSTMDPLLITQTTSGSSLNLYGTLTSTEELTITSASPIQIFNSGNLSSMGDMLIQAPSLDSSSAPPGNSLTLSAGGSDITISGTMGGINPLNQLTISMVNNLTLPSVIAAQVGITAASTTLNGNISALTGTLTINSPIILDGSITITAGNSSQMTLVGDITGSAAGFGIILGGLGPISLDADITTNNGNIAINGPLTLVSNSIFTTMGGDIDLADVDGAVSLTMSAGVGAVNFHADIGSMTPPTSLTVSSSGSIGPNPALETITAGTIALTSSGNMTLSSMTTTSAMSPLSLTQTMAAPGVSLKLGGMITSADGIAIMSAAPIAITSSSTLTSQTSNLTIQAPSIDNVSSSTNADLTLSAPSGNIIFTGLAGIGLIQPLSTFTILSANQVILPAIATKAGGVNVTATMLTLAGNITTQNGPISLNSPFDITTSILLSAGVAPVTLGGDVTSLGLGDSFTVSGTGDVFLNGNITTNNGAITINGPLVLQSATPTLSSSGGTISLNAVDGAKVLTVDAGAGIAVLTGAIGGSIPVLSFSANASTVYLGNNVSSLGGPIVFNADAVRNNINSVTLNSLPGGAIVFNGTINADISGVRGLTLLSGTGTITLGNAIGDVTSLGALSLSGGIIDFQGQLYHALSQSYTGTAFNFSFQTLLLSEGDIFFQSGPINLLGSGPFIVDTSGGDFQFASLVGMNRDVAVFSGLGDTTLGTMSGVDELAVFAHDILLKGTITATQLSFAAASSITNFGIPQPLNLMGTSIFETQSGTIGTLASPISVNNPTGIVIAGTPSMLADFSGVTVDNTIHQDPNNIPCPVIFNNVVIHACVLPPPPPSPPGPPPPPPPPVVPPLAAREFYVPGIYSQYDSLATDYYFFPEIVDKAYVTPWANPLFFAQKQILHPLPAPRIINKEGASRQYRPL